MTARSRRYLLPLSIAAVLVLIAGLWLGRSRNSTESSAAAGAKVLPALAGKLNDVNEIRIVKPGEVPLVTLKRVAGADQKDSWQVVERGGYPADFSKVRELLMKLSQMEIVEEKTSNPESYAALGVEDIKSDKATGKRIDLKGLQPPVSLIVGKSANYSGNYVRLAGTDRSLQAKPQITIYDGPPVWLNRSLLDLKEEDVQEVRVSNVGKTNYKVTRQARDQNDFSVPEVPKGRKLTSASTPSTTASALSNLGLEDVRPLGKDEDWSKDGCAVFHYFDGTVITVMGRKSDDKHWVRFEVGFDETQHGKFKQKDSKNPAEVRGEAQKLNARLKDWVFEIQAYRYDNIFRPLDDLLEKVEEKKKK